MFPTIMVPRGRRFAIARATIGLSVVALVFAAALGIVVIAQPPSIVHRLTTTFTSASTLTTIATSTSTATSTVTSVSTQTVTEAIPSECLGSSSVFESDLGTLKVGTSSPAIVCLQIYEFDANSSIVLDPGNIIVISGVNPETQQLFFRPSNFTITASSDSVTLGGPTNANEGVVLAIAITTKPGTSGTYWVTMTGGYSPLESAVAQGYGPGAYYLSDQGGATGGPNGVLVAGTGQPDYAPPTPVLGGYLGCTTGFHIQGIAYNICPDALYYRIIGVTNSTQ